MLKLYGWLARIGGPLLVVAGVLGMTHTHDDAIYLLAAGMIVLGFITGVAGEFILRRCRLDSSSRSP